MSSVESGLGDPVNYDKAWNHNNPTKRKMWRAGIQKELKSMKNKRVWKVIKKENIPLNHHLIGNKWVFKTKKDKVHHTRLVVLRYSQILGLDYTDNFAPMINDVTFRIILMIALVKGWDTDVMNVETTFLYGDLDEEIFMEFLEGYKSVRMGGDNECLALQKALYGLMQAACQWWKKFM